MSPEKPKRGGRRPGAGRPPAEPKRRLWYTVPERHANDIDNLITNLLKNYPNAATMEPAIRPTETTSHDAVRHRSISHNGNR